MDWHDEAEQDRELVESGAQLVLRAVVVAGIGLLLVLGWVASSVH